MDLFQIVQPTLGHLRKGFSFIGDIRKSLRTHWAIRNGWPHTGPMNRRSCWWKSERKKIYLWMDIFWVMRRIFSSVFYRQHPCILLARYQEDRWVYIFRENVVLLPKLWNKMHILHSHIWIICKKMLLCTNC